MSSWVGRFVIAEIVLACACSCFAGRADAAAFAGGSNIVGEVREYRLHRNESLLEVTRKFDLGFNAIAAANASLDPWVPPEGSVVTIPTAWILPDRQLRKGIVINLPELRLYFFLSSGKVLTYPLGIGEQGSATPLGRYRVIEKIVAPAWHVPASIRAERPMLPDIIPPGPDNPLGSHALRLSRHDLLIHGTNRPWGIGRRTSHGCLRLYPADIFQLFKRVPVGTRVTIIDQSLKACSRGNKVYLEVHRPQGKENSVGDALRLLASKKLLGKADFAKVIKTVEQMKGIPVDVTLTFKG